MALGTRTPRELPMRRIDSFIGEVITRYNILAIRSEVVSVGSPLVPERLWKALGVISVLVRESSGTPFFH
jgi:hypothetical protein